jgi:hypothetical protein
MNNKLGKMVQKSSGVFLRTPRELSTQMQSGSRKKATFGILERGRAIGAKVGRAKACRRLNFEFCNTRLLNPARCKRPGDGALSFPSRARQQASQRWIKHSRIAPSNAISMDRNYALATRRRAPSRSAARFGSTFGTPFQKSNPGQKSNPCRASCFQPGASVRLPFSKMAALARCRLGSSRLASSQRRTKTNSEGIQTLREVDHD